MRTRYPAHHSDCAEDTTQTWSLCTFLVGTAHRCRSSVFPSIGAFSIIDNCVLPVRRADRTKSPEEGASPRKDKIAAHTAHHPAKGKYTHAPTLAVHIRSAVTSTHQQDRKTVASRRKRYTIPSIASYP
mmetsp:Transcript_16766/g.40224  ORF Transcript_16766/g.40224 Transcript_16766/m.40224 type:complete len:129 (+) Transcript_16766:32-418(+)